MSGAGPLRLPVSAKAVIADGGRILLGRNDRAEWELPGGRLEAGERVADAIRREVREETGLEVEVGRLLLADTFEPVPGRSVLIVAHAARAVGGEPAPSDEHEELAWVDLHRLDAIALPAVYRVAIRLAVG